MLIYSLHKILKDVVFFYIMNNITKEQLINNIKEWIQYDNELKEIQKKIKIQDVKYVMYQLII